MIRIGITGVPGSGKTTLARAIAAKCRSIPQLNRVELVYEYARRYISKHGPVNEIWEQYRIMEKQIEWEDSVPMEHTDIIISDSPVHMGFIYATGLVTNKSKDVMIYNDIFKKLTKLNIHKPRYDVVFHLPPILKPVKDGVRPDLHFQDDWRYKTDKEIRFLFNVLFKPSSFTIIEHETVEERVNTAISEIEKCLNI